MINASTIGHKKGKNYSFTHCSSNCLITIESGTPSKAAFSAAASHRSSGILTLLIFPPIENFLSELFNSAGVDFDLGSSNVIDGGYPFKPSYHSGQPTVYHHIPPRIVKCMTNVFTNVIHVQSIRSCIPKLVAV